MRRGRDGAPCQHAARREGQTVEEKYVYSYSDAELLMLPGAGSRKRQPRELHVDADYMYADSM